MIHRKLRNKVISITFVLLFGLFYIIIFNKVFDISNDLNEINKQTKLFKASFRSTFHDKHLPFHHLNNNKTNSSIHLNNNEKNILEFIIDKINKTNKNKTDDYIRKSILNSIDIVYTWVNGTDKKWENDKEKWYPSFYESLTSKKYIKEELNEDKNVYHMSLLANGNNRFKDHNELKYSLRSIEKYLKWIRRIYIVVSDGQYPSWLNKSNEKIYLVNHSSIFINDLNTSFPNFNSAMIESNLNNIPGLSDYFIYFNDDTFLHKTIELEDFFIKNIYNDTSYLQNQLFYHDSYGSPFECSRNCTLDLLNNQLCNKECNNVYCGWDYYDCGPLHYTENLNKYREIQEDIIYNHPKRFFHKNSGNFMSQIYYTNQVFNRLIGKLNINLTYFKYINHTLNKMNHPRRLAISHVPILINKNILKDIKTKFFYYEYKLMYKTNHRFRHPEDLQFQFTYVYYNIENQMFAPNIIQIWDIAIQTYLIIKDTNNNNINYDFLYGKKEIKLLPHELEKKNKIRNTISYNKLYKCMEIIYNKYNTNNTNNINSTNHILFNKNWFINCHKYVINLYEKYEIRLPTSIRTNNNNNNNNNNNKHMVTLPPKDSYTFISLTDNEKMSIRSLKNIKKIKSKFICCEDDMRFYNEKIEDTFQNTFQYLFPNSSSYENSNK